MVPQRIADPDPVASTRPGGLQGDGAAAPLEDPDGHVAASDGDLPAADRSALLRYTGLAALALGALETAKALAVAHGRGIDFGVGRALATNMSWWLLWVPVAWAVFRLAGRVPLGTRSLRTVAIHAVACLVLSLLHLGISAVVIWRAALVPPGASHTLAGQFGSLFASYLFMEVVTYGALLAAHSAFMTRARARAAEAEQARLRFAAAEADAERARLESLATRARLRALRSELDPHFLFNSLNSVAALARRGDTRGTVRMISRIGALLRATLDGQDETEVTVGEEMELLRLYLEIEEVRFGSRLSTAIRMDSAARSALVPALILQPLVENAIRHGASAVRRAVSVEVTARVDGDRLRLSVRDTGPGPNGSVRESSDECSGLGLRNVRQRLAALEGSAAGLVLRELPGGGAEACVTLPFRAPTTAEIPG